MQKRPIILTRLGLARYQFLALLTLQAHTLSLSFFLSLQDFLDPQEEGVKQVRGSGRHKREHAIAAPCNHDDDKPAGAGNSLRPFPLPLLPRDPSSPLWKGVETPEKEHPRERFRGSTERFLMQPLANYPV